MAAPLIAAGGSAARGVIAGSTKRYRIRDAGTIRKAVSEGEEAAARFAFGKSVNPEVSQEEARKIAARHRRIGPSISRSTRKARSAYRSRLRKKTEAKTSVRLRAIGASIWLAGWLIIGYIFQLVMAAISIIGYMIETSFFGNLIYGSGIVFILFAWGMLCFYNIVFMAFAWQIYAKVGVKSFNTIEKNMLALISFAGFSFPFINLFPWMVPWMVYVTKNPE